MIIGAPTVACSLTFSLGAHSTRCHTPLLDQLMVMKSASTVSVKFSPRPFDPNSNHPCLPVTCPCPSGLNTGILRDPSAPCLILVGDPPCSILHIPVRFVWGGTGVGGGGGGGPPGHPLKSQPGQLNDGLWSPAGSSVLICVSKLLDVARSSSGGSHLPAVFQFAAAMLNR